MFRRGIESFVDGVEGRRWVSGAHRLAEVFGPNGLFLCCFVRTNLSTLGLKSGVCNKRYTCCLHHPGSRIQLVLHLLDFH